jgi:anaerobic selenocysteine-containing dehydrogenase
MQLALVIMLFLIGKSWVDIMALKLYTNETWLRKRFHLDKKTPEQIATECGVSAKTIYQYIDKFGLRKLKK